MVVLCTHNIYIEVLRLIDYKLFDNFLINCKGGTYIATTIVLLLEWPTILFFRDHLTWMVGKAKIK